MHVTHYSIICWHARQVDNLFYVLRIQIVNAMCQALKKRLSVCSSGWVLHQTKARSMEVRMLLTGKLSAARFISSTRRYLSIRDMLILAFAAPNDWKRCARSRKRKRWIEFNTMDYVERLILTTQHGALRMVKAMSSVSRCQRMA